MHPMKRPGFPGTPPHVTVHVCDCRRRRNERRAYRSADQSAFLLRGKLPRHSQWGQAIENGPFHESRLEKRKLIGDCDDADRLFP